MKQLFISLFVLLQSILLIIPSDSWAQKWQNIGNNNKTAKPSIQKNSNATHSLPFENSLLWEVSGNGLSQASYLFGTIHQICESDFFWMPHMKTAFDKTTALVLEINLKEVETFFGEDGATFAFEEDEVPVSHNSFSIDTSIYTEMATDPTHKNENIRKAAEAALQSDIKTNAHRIPQAPKSPIRKGAFRNQSFMQDIDEVYAMPEVRKVEIISEEDSQPVLETSDCQAFTSYEMELISMADKANKETSGLETMDEQLALLEKVYESLTDTEETMEEKEILKGSSQQQFDELIVAYKSQNITKMLQLLYDFEIGPSTIYLMIDERNEKWMKTIPHIIQSSSKFIAVGAGHLAGEKGLINLLRNKGYTVKPITN